MRSWVPRQREGQGRHCQDGPEHRLRRVQGGQGRLSGRAQGRDVPVAGRQEGHRLARGAGAREAALPHAALESASVKEISRLVVIAIALWFGSASVAGAQPPLRIGASLSQTGPYAAAGQNEL